MANLAFLQFMPKYFLRYYQNICLLIISLLRTFHGTHLQKKDNNTQQM